MSYSIALYRVETKGRAQKFRGSNFFDDAENLEPFTAQQAEKLRTRLLKYGYEFKTQDNAGAHFRNSKNETFALLTDCGLYFTASFDEKQIFEVSMTASEFTDSGEFAKYDPQRGSWESNAE